jgi:uncharacterized protein YggU (UPF0235/DUF167 family)
MSDSARRLQIRVTPKASANRVKEEVDAQGETLYRIYVTTVAEDGKANASMLKLLAKYLGVAPSKLEILRGHTSRDKLVEVQE